MSDPVYELALKLWRVHPKTLDAEGYISKAYGGEYTNPRAAWYAAQIQAHIDAMPTTLSAAMELPEVRALVERVEQLNAACDAMWNDHDRIENCSDSIRGTPYALKEKHMKAISEAQQRLPAALAAIKEPKL